MFFSRIIGACTAVWASTSLAAALPRLNNVFPRDSACTNTPSTRGCWSDGFSVATDMDLKWPSTGNTVSYHLDITETESISSDGVKKPMMVVNGQYPGPTIYADWGDVISVTVKNSMTSNGTGIHWHGIRQLGSNQMDGTNGITECPIAPGTSKTYTFKATQFGTSWYHSHYSVQYAAGIVGGIVIRGPATANYDIDLGTYTLTDWFHTPDFTVNSVTSHAFGPPTADNILINGSHVSSAGGKYSVTTLEPKKKHLLRIVNTGVNNWFHVGLDGHPFTVVAADFVPIVPYITTSLSIAIGQRYDVIINANATVDNYWFRAGIGGGRCDGPNAVSLGKSIFSYSGASSGDPKSTGITLPGGCYDEAITPYDKTTVPSSAPAELILQFSQTAATGNLVQWLINGSAINVNWDYPTLQFIIDGNTSYPKHENIYEIETAANQWQYWVIQNHPTNFPLPHPIHLHGHDFFVLGSGTGTFSDPSTLNYNNPPRRDTATLPGSGWLVLAFPADNPGAWLMHCHIPFHISQGFGLQFLERREEILGAIGDLGGFREGCEAWKAFAGPGFVQGDSGL